MDASFDISWFATQSESLLEKCCSHIIAGEADFGHWYLRITWESTGYKREKTFLSLTFSVISCYKRDSETHNVNKGTINKTDFGNFGFYKIDELHAVYNYCSIFSLKDMCFKS